MRMARINVYLPDELAEQARDAVLNVSALTQAAIRAALLEVSTDGWLETLLPPSSRPDHEAVLVAIDDGRDEPTTHPG